MEGVILIRRVEERDAEALAAVVAEAPEAAQWRTADFRKVAAQGGAKLWVAEAEGEVVGFCCERAVGGEAEVLNLAVRRTYRNRGIGGRLLQHAVEEARRAGARRVYLELRASNDAARRLYERHGFLRIGTRRGYYTNPAEDAIVLAREIGEQEESKAGSRGST